MIHLIHTNTQHDTHHAIPFSSFLALLFFFLVVIGMRDLRYGIQVLSLEVMVSMIMHI